MKPEFETRKVICYLDLVDFFKQEENFDDDAFWDLLTDDDFMFPVNITNGCHLPWQINQILDYFKNEDHDIVTQFNNLLLKHYDVSVDEELLLNIWW